MLLVLNDSVRFDTEKNSFHMSFVCLLPFISDKLTKPFKHFGAAEEQGLPNSIQVPLSIDHFDRHKDGQLNGRYLYKIQNI